MTTRITLAILLTTWIVLMIGEAAAYLTARQILLVVWDDSLMTRAALPLEEHGSAREGVALSSGAAAGDSYEIRDEHAGETIATTRSEPATHKQQASAA